MTVPVGPTPRYTDRTKRVLELSLRESLQLGHNYIAPEHLLLALVREGESVAARVLRDIPVRDRVMRALQGFPSDIQTSAEKEEEPDNEVVVGVTRIAGFQTAGPSEPATGAVRCHWVSIGGKLLPGLIQSTECHNSAGPMEVVIRFIASGYRTTDAFGPDRPKELDNG